MFKLNCFLNFVIIVLLNIKTCHLSKMDEVDFNTIGSNLPVRIVKHPRSQIALKSAQVFFSCEYETSQQNHPPQQNLPDSIDSFITVKWLFNLSPLKQQQQQREGSEYLIEKTRLTINSFDPSKHTGQFRCLINNTLFSPPLVILSEPANLTLASIDDFDLSSNEETSHLASQLSVSEGNAVIIPCHLPNSAPNAVPIFYFNDSPLPTVSIFNLDLNLVSRFKIFPSGNLQIANVKYSDSGVYRCAAQNPVTRQLKNNTKKFSLKVFEPFGTKLPEIVYVPVDTNRVQVGANLSLECVASGAPVPLVSWEKFGGVLPEKRSQQIFGNLIITNVQPEDKGTYVCRAENGPGQATFKTAMVDVYEAPTLVLPQSDQLKHGQSVKRGESVEVKCPIRSRPRSDITWFYQGKQIISSNQHRISISGDKSTLTIRNFQPSQSAGIYQCYAQNEYGHRQVDLIVLPGDVELDSQPPQIKPSSQEMNTELTRKPSIIMGPQNTSIYEGQTVVLLCVTSETSSGGVQINWLQNDLIIEPTLMRRFEINQLLGNLKIVSVQKSDAGVYKCIVSNEYGMSTAEAFVQVKSSNNNNNNNDKTMNTNNNNNKSKLNLILTSPVSTKPSIQQIGADKILLKWQLVDSETGSTIDYPENIAYFKVDYKTTSKPQSTWLTIDEQIEPKKREYILTDLSKFDAYKFRVSTFFLNGDLNHGHSSLRFKLEPVWSASSISHGQLKLNQIQTQITQIWPISSTSLGVRWKTYLPSLLTNNESDSLLQSKINGFYIYYRKTNPNSDKMAVQLYNFTRINIATSSMNAPHIIDTYIIANLEPSSHYELKMTCYNINGDLCSFSNTLHGLTQSSSHHQQQQQSLSTTINSTEKNSVIYLKSKQNEILFMVLGVVLGILTLLLIIFIIMCVIRQRQHKRLLAQLHNTSQKLTSSSCPTLIYEDSLRNNNNNNNNNNNTNLHHHNSQIKHRASSSQHQNLFSSNDSNSTNSQSMSTTTSSITTPPTCSESAVTPSHVLMLGGNTVSLHQPPLPPNLPPPLINQNSTLSRININMNPMNFIDANFNKNTSLSPNYLNNNNNNNNNSNQAENYYHTLTTLGTLSQFEDPNYAEYNTTTLNIRNHLLKQQQIIMNTLKTMNMKQQQQQQLQCSATSTLEVGGKCEALAPKSPASRRSSSNSSKKGKKTHKNQTHSDLQIHPQHLLQIQQQQQKNYYLMPNIRAQSQNGFVPNQMPIHNIYNEAEILNNLLLTNAGASLNPTNLYFLSNPTAVNTQYSFQPVVPTQQQQQQAATTTTTTTFSPGRFTNSMQSPAGAECDSMFHPFHHLLIDNHNTSVHQADVGEAMLKKDAAIYESSDIDMNAPDESEPMISSNFARNEQERSSKLHRDNNN